GRTGRTLERHVAEGPQGPPSVPTVPAVDPTRLRPDHREEAHGVVPHGRRVHTGHVDAPHRHLPRRRTRPGAHVPARRPPDRGHGRRVGPPVRARRHPPPRRNGRPHLRQWHG